MSFIIYIAWLVLGTSLVNIAIKLGWDHDPGYMAPAIIIILLNIHSVLYASATKNTPKTDS
jgi:hypothetical protein